MKEMQKLLADYYSLSLKLQCYHWNVEGENFIQLHEMFGDLYEKTSEKIDDIAEIIRFTFHQKIPVSFNAFSSISTLAIANENFSSKEMIKDIANDFKSITMLASNICAQEKDGTVQRFLESMIDENKKQSWFFNSILA